MGVQGRHQERGPRAAAIGGRAQRIGRRGVGARGSRQSAGASGFLLQTASGMTEDLPRDVGYALRGGLARVVLSVGLLSPWPLPAAAQTYPAKRIKIVVPFPAGGIADIYSRLIGNGIADAWGQPVVVEN